MSGKPINPEIDYSQVSFKTGYFDSAIHRKIFGGKVKGLGLAWTKESWQGILKFHEYCFKANPTNFAKAGGEMRFFQLAMLMVHEKYILPLNDMVRASNILLHHIQKPSFFFKEMVQSQDSFAADVQPQVLNEMVDQIIARSSQTEVSFEHLQASHSAYHQHFEPYNKHTFSLLHKILNDLIRNPEDSASIKMLGLEHFQVINKILA